MGKYLVLWEVDQAGIPIDPKERGEGWGLLMAMIRQDFEKGKQECLLCSLRPKRGILLRGGPSPACQAIIT